MAKFYTTLSLAVLLATLDESCGSTYASNYGYNLAAGAPPSSQYHAQDDFGQYSFGFSSPDQTKSELKTADGVVRGAYSYIDSNGIVQTVNYIADALGFRVAATNLPVQQVANEEADIVSKSLHEEPDALEKKTSQVMHPTVDYSYLPYAPTYQYYAAPSYVAYQPIVPAYAAAPLVAPQAAAPLPIVQAQAPAVHSNEPVVAAQSQTVSVPVAVTVDAAATGSQYHAQDDFGQYSFGYNDPNSVRQEVKTADGVVRGAYQYVDSFGKLQTVNYIADSLGFRVAATNLPVAAVDLPVQVQDTPAVAAAKKSHYEAKAAPLVALPVAAPLPIVQAQAPAVHNNEPVVAAKSQTVAVPVAVTVDAADTGSQYHAQDDFGQYSFGYNEPNSVRQEVKTADGVVRGAYQYVDSDNKLQTVNYIADSLGFRVAATNLPVAPVDLPVQVQDTPAVAAAKKEHYESIGALELAVSSVPEVYEVPEVPFNTPLTEQVAPITNNALLESLYESSGDDSIESSGDDSIEPEAYQKPADPIAPKSPEIALKPIVTQSVDNDIIPASPIIATTSSQEGSQYHAQDNFGQYSFGYRDGNSVKQEVKTADGIVRGAYSYVDSNGIVQSVNYIADALGFRVGATNLPVHNVDKSVNVPLTASPVEPVVNNYVPEVTPIQPSVLSPKVSYSYLPYAAGYGYALPAAAYVVGNAGNVVETHGDPANTQFHAQDDFGQYNYGFSNPTQTKQEVKTADGVTRGSYSYLDANGLVQSVNYISDAMGFRVAATNLPVHIVPESTSVESEDVAAFKVADIPLPEKPSPIITPNVQYAYLPYAPSYGYYGAAARPAVQVPTVNYVEAPKEVVKPLYTQQIYFGGAAAYLPVVQEQVVEIKPEAYDIVDLNLPQISKPLVQKTPIVSVAQTNIAEPSGPQGSQYHAQDDYGQYSFGYSDGNSVKQEIKTADGVVRGGYSYVDSNGILQTVNYIADALGFRVAATNLPVHEVPDFQNSVVADEVEPEPYIEEPKEESDSPNLPIQQTAVPVVPVISPKVAYAYLPYASSYGYAIPSSVDQEIDGNNAQFHAQDDFGQYNYGFSSPTQTKQEVKTGDGVTRGSYSYVDANGLIQSVNYIADAMGFRVAATNLPVHVVPGVPAEKQQQPIVEQKTVLTPQVQYSYLPYAQNYGYTIPVGEVVKA